MTDHFTAEELDVIDAYCEAATIGPWMAEEDRHIAHCWHVHNENEGLLETEEQENAEFAARARTDLPRLSKAHRAALGILDLLVGTACEKDDSCKVYSNVASMCWPCIVRLKMTQRGSMKEAKRDS